MKGDLWESTGRVSFPSLSAGLHFEVDILSDLSLTTQSFLFRMIEAAVRASVRGFPLSVLH